MNYVKYNRTFVMLEEQTRDYCARDAPIKGYLKVETGNNKGAMRCVVQNLKYYSRGDYIYKLIFFGKKQDRTIHTVMGNLIINRYGNGETYFRFDPINMDGKGNGYSDFTVAIVAATSSTNDKEPLHPVLKGVTRTENSSFRHEEKFLEEKVEKCDAEDQSCMSEKVIEEVSKEEPSVENERDYDRAELKPEEEVVLERPERNIYNAFYNEYLLQFCTYTCKVAGYYEDVTPFERDQTGARWKRVQNVGNLPLVSPGAHYFATQYKHYLFGAKPDSNGQAEEYFFAIPGRFTQEEQPDGGRSGFVYWQPMIGAPHEKAAYGYWIVSVDSKSGDILEVRA